MNFVDDSIEDKALTIGAAMPNTEVKIIDPDTGDTVPIGEVGELCVRGYHVMVGYHDMPEQAAEAIDEDGWLRTGDLAAMDERGYCTVEGRLKDMIIRGGENIYPKELEEMLLAHPAVAEVAVVGLPDGSPRHTPRHRCRLPLPRVGRCELGDGRDPSCGWGREATMNRQRVDAYCDPRLGRPRRATVGHCMEAARGAP